MKKLTLVRREHGNNGLIYRALFFEIPEENKEKIPSSEDESRKIPNSEPAKPTTMTDTIDDEIAADIEREIPNCNPQKSPTANQKNPQRLIDNSCQENVLINSAIKASQNFLQISPLLTTLTNFTYDDYAEYSEWVKGNFPDCELTPDELLLRFDDWRKEKGAYALPYRSVELVKGWTRKYLKQDTPQAPNPPDSIGSQDDREQRLLQYIAEHECVSERAVENMIRFQNLDPQKAWTAYHSNLRKK